jgi:hypothetical protein
MCVYIIYVFVYVYIYSHRAPAGCRGRLQHTNLVHVRMWTLHVAAMPRLACLATPPGAYFNRRGGMCVRVCVCVCVGCGRSAGRPSRGRRGWRRLGEQMPLCDTLGNGWYYTHTCTHTHTHTHTHTLCKRSLRRQVIYMYLCIYVCLCV